MSKPLILLLIATAILPVRVASQQGPPLPAAMRGEFIGLSCFAMCPTADSAQYDTLSLWTRFDTDRKEVRLEWWYTAPGADDVYHDIETHSVSFEPTAMCPKAGASDTFFVAGYVQRTGHTIVEAWTVTDLAGGTVAGPGGITKSTLAKDIHKEVLFMAPTSAVGPIRAMAYHKTQDRLWFMEEAAPYRIMSVDSQGDDLQTIADEAAIPGLGDFKDMAAAMIKSTAPDGGGFLIELYPWRSWKPKWRTGGDLQWETEILIFRDSTLTGVVDETAMITIQARYNRAYPPNEEYPFQ